MAKGTVNKVTILGRLGQDPDIRTTASGTMVANLSVATTELGTKDQNGNRQEETEWHRVTLFGRTAEIASQYLSKGSQIYVEGRLRTRKWQDQNGQDRYTTEILGNEMQFIGGKSEGQQSAQGFQQPDQKNAGFTQRPSEEFKQQAMQKGQGFDDFDDDIPF